MEGDSKIIKWILHKLFDDSNFRVVKDVLLID